MLRRALVTLAICLAATTLATPAFAEGSGFPQIITPVDGSTIHPGFSTVDVDLSDAPAGDYHVEVTGLPGRSDSPSYDVTQTITNVGASSVSFPSFDSYGLYSVMVEPVNPDEAMYSATSFFTVADRPAAPGIRVSKVRSHTAALAWSPGDSRGSEITRYQVERGGIEGVSSNRYFSTSSTQYTATGLRDGLRWSFRVRAHNAQGLGSWSRWVSARPNTPVFEDCFRSARRPGHFQLACGDGNGYFDRAGWTHWGDDYAAGTARQWYNTCKPYCAAGNYRYFRVKVRLDRTSFAARHHFTRLRYGRDALSHTVRLPA